MSTCVVDGEGLAVFGVEDSDWRGCIKPSFTSSGLGSVSSGPEVLALQFVPRGSTDIAVSNRVRPITLKSQGVSIHFSTPLTAAVACFTLLHIVSVVASEAGWKANKR